MIRKIHVRAVYPIMFDMEIDDEQDISKIKESILDQADKYFEVTSVDPLIGECLAYDNKSLPDLTDY